MLAAVLLLPCVADACIIIVYTYIYVYDAAGFRRVNNAVAAVVVVVFGSRRY